MSMHVTVELVFVNRLISDSDHANASNALPKAFLRGAARPVKAHF